MALKMALLWLFAFGPQLVLATRVQFEAGEAMLGLVENGSVMATHDLCQPPFDAKGEIAKATVSFKVRKVKQNHDEWGVEVQIPDGGWYKLRLTTLRFTQREDGSTRWTFMGGSLRKWSTWQYTHVAAGCEYWPDALKPLAAWNGVVGNYISSIVVDGSQPQQLSKKLLEGLRKDEDVQLTITYDNARKASEAMHASVKRDREYREYQEQMQRGDSETHETRSAEKGREESNAGERSREDALIQKREIP